MYRVARLNVHSKAQDLLDSFSVFAEKRLHPCLLGQDPNNIPNAKIIAIGAYSNETPIGLALASLHPFIHYVDVHSLYVQPEHRNHNLGHQLLETLQKEAFQAGGWHFSLVYPLEDPLAPVIEKILSDLEWKGQKLFMIKCFFDPYTFNTPWLHHKISYPSGYEEFFWKDLTEEDRAELRRQEKQRLYPPVLSAFLDESRIEPLNSLGLRYKGKIVGWCITHRIDPETIRYTTLYVQKPQQYQRVGIMLLSHSIRLHTENPTRVAVCEVPVPYVHSSWVHLVEKRLVPYTTKTIHYIQAWKTLK